MRLATLSLVSAFMWVFAAGVALGDTSESAAAEFDLRGGAAPDEPTAPEKLPFTVQEAAAGQAPLAENEFLSGDDFES